MIQPQVVTQPVKATKATKAAAQEVVAAILEDPAHQVAIKVVVRPRLHQVERAPLAHRALRLKDSRLKDGFSGYIERGGTCSLLYWKKPTRRTTDEG